MASEQEFPERISSPQKVVSSEPTDEPRLRDLPVTLGNIPRMILLALIRLYQATFSRAMPAGTCRFYPS